MNNISTIETLERKLAEALAENERLRKVIDEAQKQEPVRTECRYLTSKYGQPEYRSEWAESHPGKYGAFETRKLYAAPVPAQQLQAVHCNVKNVLHSLAIDKLMDGFELPMDVEDVVRFARKIERAVLSKSPSITEQDARDILVNFTLFRLKGHAMQPFEIVEKWLASEDGRELLEKLNNQPAATAQPWQPIETAPTEPHSTAIIFSPSDSNDGTVGEAFLGKDGNWYWAGSEVGYHDPIMDCNSPPTHWMPMPTKPTLQEEA